MTPWSFLYRKDLLLKHRFPPGQLCEDLGITHRYIHAAERIALVNSPLYIYTAGRRGSIWNTPTARLYSDGYEMGMVRVYDLEEWGYDTAYLRQLIFLYLLVHEGEKGRYGGDCAAYLRSVKAPDRDLDPVYRLMIRLFRRSPALFHLICRLTGQRKIKD